MTPQQKMYEAIYKALGEGLAKLIKNGLAFTVLIGVVGGLIWALFAMSTHNENAIAELKQEIREMKKEHSDQLNLLRSEIYECDAERRKLAVQVAELRVLTHRKNTQYERTN